MTMNHSNAPSNKSSIRTALLLPTPFIYATLFNGRYIDDSYITLAYVRTLTKYHVWGMAADHLSNAATSALDIILLSIFAIIFRSPTAALYFFNVTLIFVTYFSLRRIGQLVGAKSDWPVIATALLFSNPLLVSTLGLESYLFLIVLLGLCITFTERRFVSTGFLVGMLYMTRPEGALAGFVVLAMLLYRRDWRGLVFILPAATVFLAWSIFSWTYLGSVVPDTFFLKRNQASWEGYSYFKGLYLYLSSFPIATLLSFIWIAALPLAITELDYRRNSVVPLLAIFTVAHFVAYSALGVPPYHWYYAPEAAFVTLIGSLALSNRLRSNVKLHSAFFLCIVAINVGTTFISTVLMDRVPIQTNWGTVAEYKAIAQWLNGHIQSRRIFLQGELGVLQYYADADMIDSFSDRKFIPALLDSNSSPLKREILRLNFRHATPLVTNDIQLTIGTCDRVEGAIRTWETTSPWRGRHQWCLIGTDTHP